MRAILLQLAVTTVLASPVSAPAADAPPAGRIPVKVERVEPEKEKLSTLRFLKENRDFFRGRMDVIRQTPHEVDPATAVLDERMLALEQMLEDLLAARDTLAHEQAREAGRRFLAGVAEVGELEAHLDLLEEILADQERRLWELQEDFLGRQSTALVVVVRGTEHLPDTFRMTDGYGEEFAVSPDPRQRASLVQGGILMIYHDFVEPRPQTWRLRLEGGEWTQNETAFLSFEPARNRLTFLQLDLGEAYPDRGPTTVRTSAWVHEPPRPAAATGLR